MRLVIAALALVWSAYALAHVRSIARWLSERVRWMPPGLEELVVISFPALFVAAVVVVVATGLLLFILAVGRALSESVIPAARAALGVATGVATGVAPWAGKDPDDRVVALQARGPSTFAFGISDVDGPANAAAQEAGPQMRGRCNQGPMKWSGNTGK